MEPYGCCNSTCKESFTASTAGPLVLFNVKRCCVGRAQIAIKRAFVCIYVHIYIYIYICTYICIPEILLQERLDENLKCRSFSWQVLRKASEFFGAKTYIGETGLTTPPFFSNARRRTKISWGMLDDSPAIVNWNGLDPMEQAEITPTWKRRIIGPYLHLVRRMLPLPLPRYRKAPREFFIRKAKPAGREGGGGRERINLPRTA